MGVRTSIVQLNCSSAETMAARVSRVMGLLDQLAGNTDFVLLPELWNTGAFDLISSREHSQPIDGPLPTALAAKARENGMWIHGGSFCEKDGESLFNTSVLFNDQGELVARYRKVHVFTYANEQDIMTPGENYVVTETPLGLTGLATCYDTRFPEMFRSMRDAGAQAFLIPSGWPTARISQWNALLPARAIENQAWVVAGNQVGVQGTHVLGGNSAIIDPMGVTRTLGGDCEEVLTWDVEPELANEWRTEFPAHDDVVYCEVN